MADGAAMNGNINPGDVAQREPIHYAARVGYDEPTACGKTDQPKPAGDWPVVTCPLCLVHLALQGVPPDKVASTLGSAEEAGPRFIDRKAARDAGIKLRPRAPLLIDGQVVYQGHESITKMLAGEAEWLRLMAARRGSSGGGGS